METFMPDPRPLRGRRAATGSDQESGSDPGIGDWRPAIEADNFPLADACSEESMGPYQIINTNIILIGSENSVVRNRGGESFFLSPLYSGCDRTGWHPTRTFFGPNPGPDPQQDQFLRLSTAMAISGAAFGPNTGPSGRGPLRNAIVSRLLMLFGLRLAYWVP
jgi:hypothetical protein